MKQRAVIGSVASKTVISMLTTVRVKEGQKPPKTLNWRHCLIMIRAKRKIEAIGCVGKHSLREKRPQYEQRHEKVILQHDNARPHVAKPVKTYLETSNEKSCPTRRIPQILRRPIITCSGRWHMVWLISSSAYMKTSKNGLIRR